MLRTSQILQLSVIALLGVGLIMVNSSGMVIGAGRADPVGMLTSRAAVYAGLAVALMLLASRLNVRELFRLKGWTNPLGWLVAGSVICVVLSLIPHIGREVNGARRWLDLGLFSFQPSELIKWIMVLAIAWWCARRRGVMHTFMHGLVPPLILLALACGLIIVQDLGTAALVGVVALIMLIAGGARWWHLATIVPPAACAVVLAIMHSPYRKARLVAFMDPYADSQGNGYHPIQSMLAIAEGGLFGRGMGNGIQKFGYLPEDTTDFIFAIICEEMGIFGALTVIALYLVIFWAGLRVVRESKDIFGKLVAMGVVLTLGIQAAINVAVVTVMVPTKGIALPLISGGGTGWIMTAFAVGLVAAIDEANRLEAEAALPAIEPVAA